MQCHQFFKWQDSYKPTFTGQISLSLSLSLSQQEQFREYIEANGTRQEAAAWLMGLSRNKQKEATLGKKKIQ